MMHISASTAPIRMKQKPLYSKLNDEFDKYYYNSLCKSLKNTPESLVRACKLFLLHHRRIESAMEIRANSLQTLQRNNSCTNANYILERSCGNGEDENANPPFVQSTHKAVRASKLFLLHHHRIMPTMEISANSLQTLPRNNS